MKRRAIAIVVILASLIGACDRVIDLSRSGGPDAGGPDTGPGPDGGTPDDAGGGGGTDVGVD